MSSVELLSVTDMQKFEEVPRQKADDSLRETSAEASTESRLWTPEFGRSRAATFERMSRTNIEGMRQLLRGTDERALHPVFRLELLGEVYGLDPTPEAKEALRAAMDEWNQRQESIYITGGARSGGPYGVLSRAVTGAIDCAEAPPDVSDLIEIIELPDAARAGKQEYHVKALESLYGNARAEAERRLLKKKIDWVLLEGRPEEAEALLCEGGNLFYSRWETAALQESVVTAYLQGGNRDGARKFIESEVYQGDQVEGFLKVYDKSADPADIALARAVKTGTWYAEVEKLQKIASAAGEREVIGELNRKLEELVRSDFQVYRGEDVFEFCKKMHDKPGVNGRRLEEMLREKAALLSTLERPTAYCYIARMSKNAEDRGVVRTAIKAAMRESRPKAGKDAAPSRREEKASFLRDKEILTAERAAEAEGLLLRQYIQFLEEQPEMVTPEDRDTAWGFFHSYERVVGDGLREGRAYRLFWAGPATARERITTLFWDREDFVASLSGLTAEDVYRRGVARAHEFRRNPRVSQESFMDIFEALREKITDPGQLRAAFCELTSRIAGYMPEDESSARFLMDLIEQYSPPGQLAAYPGVIDSLRARLAQCSAETLEADILIEDIEDPFLKGLTLAEVAKHRRSIAHKAASSRETH